MTLIQILRRRARDVMVRMDIAAKRIALANPLMRGYRAYDIATRKLRVTRWHRPRYFVARRPPGPSWVRCPTCGAPPRSMRSDLPLVPYLCRGKRGGPRHAFHRARWRLARSGR